jgi:hypothetical protein
MHRVVLVIWKSSPGWLILHGHVTLNGIAKLQALTVDSHPLDITHTLGQDSPLGNYLLCEQHKVQHTTSILSIDTYVVTYACIELYETWMQMEFLSPWMSMRRFPCCFYATILLVSVVAIVWRWVGNCQSLPMFCLSPLQTTTQLLSVFVSWRCVEVSRKHILSTRILITNHCYMSLLLAFY